MFQKIVRVGKLKIGGNNPTRVMGIVNLSPESFYKKSFVNDELLVERIREMERLGAELIDIGAASTAPRNIYGTTKVDRETELSRIAKAIPIIRETTKLPISIDSTSAKVAGLALELGADLVNDVSGFQLDPKMAELVAEKKVPAIIMANCMKRYNSLEQIVNSLQKSIRIAEAAGVDLGKIILDPGIGFGKPAALDIEIIRRLHIFRLFGFPLMVGLSRKAFLGEILEKQNPEERLVGSIASTAIAVMNGADIIRTHDVRETLEAVKIGYACRREWRNTKDLQIFVGIDEKDVQIVLDFVGVDSEIKAPLAKKGVVLNVLIRKLVPPAALIVKQEMLALGGDAAYNYHTIDFSIEETDVLLMGTISQLEKLSKRLCKQDYFGLKKLGNQLKGILSKRAIVE